MHKLLTLGVCLLLGACAGKPQSAHTHSLQADSGALPAGTLPAAHHAEAVPLPVNPGQHSAPRANNDEQPPLAPPALSNYRVYALPLKKGERYRLNVSSLCDDACLDLPKPNLKPRALLLDGNGAVIASEKSPAAAGVGSLNFGWDGEVPEDGTYYLLVAADVENSGKAIVIDDVWINNSPLMAVETDEDSAPSAD